MEATTQTGAAIPAEETQRGRSGRPASQDHPGLLL